MKKIISLILSLTLTATLAYLVYLAYIEVSTLFRSANPAVVAAILTASATIIVSVISVLISKRHEHKLQIKSQLREKKLPIYQKIIETIFKITFAEKLRQPPLTDEELIEFFANTTRDLVIWGSTDMIKAFGSFRTDLAKSHEAGSTTNTLIIVENLLLAVRRDLGHEQKNIKNGDILRLFVNDFPE